MSEELKPCPFCGSCATNKRFPPNDGKPYATCSDESCSMYEVGMLYEAWNTRHAPEGYALVPAEPTEEMLAAWFGAEQVKDTQNACIMFGDKYKAMIAAATETNLACDLCEGSGKKVVGPDQDGRKYKVDCDCTKP